MGFFSARSDDHIDLEVYRDITDDVIESDYVPYACLHDPDTILTKNGQLIQIVKISGLNYDTAIDEHVPLRQAIRDVLREVIPTNDYAFWLHTLRRRVKLTPEGNFPDPFSTRVHEAWREVQQWDNAYINEIYLSIVKEHQPIFLKDKKVWPKTLRAKPINAYRGAYLESASRELTKAVDGICHKLRLYSARRLGLVEREGAFYHEGVEFLEKLINLQYRPMPVRNNDLSRELTSGDITFGYNAMEVRNPEGRRRFAAILTIKEYKEASLPALDQFLEIPCELIVSQCFDFIHSSRAKSAYELQHRYLRLGDDPEMVKMSEVVSLVESGRANIKDFGEHQTTFFVIAGSIKELENNIRMVRRALARIGILSIREDMMLEDGYWAQLPGNLNFALRMQPINTAHLAGFISLQSLPMGSATGSNWGPPVTIFPTVGGTPYFFNFHRGGAAHTTLIGAPETGKTTLLHFLLAQSRKLGARIWYIDTRGKTELWAQAAGATYQKFSLESPGLRFAPLHQPDSAVHRDFLSVWLTTLVDPTGKKINRSVIQYFRSLVDATMQLPPEQRQLSKIAQTVAEADMMLAAELTRWVGGNAFGAAFDNTQENLALGNFNVIDISEVMGNDAMRVPLACYLLQRMTMALDGKPAIIVLDEGWKLLDTPLFGSRIEEWLDHLTKENAAMIATTEDVEGSVSNNFAQKLAAKAATQLFLPNRDPLPEYMTVFGLNEQEFGYLSQMRTSERHVLIKRGRETAIVKTNLEPLGDMRYTLASVPPPVVDQELTAEQQLAALMGWKGPAGNAA
jgi:type IV secretion system protein VirB4